jgi:hypothetical protein
MIYFLRRIKEEQIHTPTGFVMVSEVQLVTVISQISNLKDIPLLGSKAEADRMLLRKDLTEPWLTQNGLCATPRLSYKTL